MQKSKVKITGQKSKVSLKNYPRPPSMKWVYLGLITGLIGATFMFLILYGVYAFGRFGNELNAGLK